MKRGQSGLSLVVAVNKPVGMSSHDVVNRCRRIFGERRVGHTGTLDPLASGVLPICIGPATRLDKYLTGHDKSYSSTIAYGYETTTDDAAGEPTMYGEPPALLFDESYAESFIASLVGTHQQMPPAYSAIKVDGVKAYEAARKGSALDLEFREIEILESCFKGLRSEEGSLFWDVEFKVSKGTYIRSLARDIGRILGAPAHVVSLQRLASGNISIDQAVTLETLEQLGQTAALDPVSCLGLRFAFADDYEKYVESGAILYGNQVSLNEPLTAPGIRDACACMGSTCPSSVPPREGELVSIVVKNRLKAIYAYNAESDIWKPDCVFSTPISRG